MTGVIVTGDVWVSDISNPGFGPIWAVHVLVGNSPGHSGERQYVLTSTRALSNDRAYVEQLASKVRTAGRINPDLWDYATQTEAEREAYLASGGDLYQWEEMEKLNGNW